MPNHSTHTSDAQLRRILLTYGVIVRAAAEAEHLGCADAAELLRAAAARFPGGADLRRRGARIHP